MPSKPGYSHQNPDYAIVVFPVISSHILRSLIGSRYVFHRTPVRVIPPYTESHQMKRRSRNFLENKESIPCQQQKQKTRQPFNIFTSNFSTRGTSLWQMR